jgi:hypothetical protein
MIIGTVTPKERQMLFLLYVNDMSTNTSTDILMSKGDSLLMYDTETHALTPEAGAYLPIMEFLATDEGLIALAKSLILRDMRSLEESVVRKSLKNAGISAYMANSALQGKCSRKTALMICAHYDKKFIFKTIAISL